MIGAEAHQADAPGPGGRDGPGTGVPGAGVPDTGVPPPRPRPVGEMSFAEASAELDGIVARFEQGEVDVDQLVRHLERATAIVEELDRRIRGTRAQVEALVPRLAALAEPRDPGSPSADGPDASPPSAGAPRH